MYKCIYVFFVFIYFLYFCIYVFMYLCIDVFMYLLCYLFIFLYLFFWFSSFIFISFDFVGLVKNEITSGGFIGQCWVVFESFSCFKNSTVPEFSINHCCLPRYEVGEGNRETFVLYKVGWHGCVCSSWIRYISFPQFTAGIEFVPSMFPSSVL